VVCQNFNILRISRVNLPFCLSQGKLPVKLHFVFHFACVYFLPPLPSDKKKLICSSVLSWPYHLLSPHNRPCRGMALLIFNFSKRWSGWSIPHPGHITPTKQPWYTGYRWLGWIQGQSGQMWRRESILSPLCLEPWTIQPYILSSHCSYKSRCQIIL
jgi:hypothetical protein